MPKHQALTAQVGGGISGFAAAAELATTYRVREHGRVGRRPRRTRAGRRRRLHHAVELPAEPDRREGRVRARRRLHRRAQAVGGRAGQRVHPRRDHRRDRLPAGRVQPRQRPGPGRRRSAGDASRRRHGVVHRFDARREAGGRARGGLGEEASRSSWAASRRSCILDDADFAAAVATGVDAAYENSGQTCSALTRMIVPRSRLAEVEELARAGRRVVHRRRSVRRRHPARSADLGGAARSRPRLHRRQGIDEGATLVTGGRRRARRARHRASS